MTFFDTVGAEFYLRCQPDKTYYKCPVCNHYHLTTDNIALERQRISTVVGKHNSKEILVQSYDGDRTFEFLVSMGDKLLYVQSYQNRKGKKVKYIEVFDEHTKKISERMKLKIAKYYEIN